jgi:hypothetical protein
VDHAGQLAEDHLRDNNQNNSGNHVQRRVRHPENAHQPDMVANPAATKLDESKHGLAAASAAWLSRLQLRTALIAKHLLLLPSSHVVVNVLYGCKHSQVPEQVLSSQSAKLSSVFT